MFLDRPISRGSLGAAALFGLLCWSGPAHGQSSSSYVVRGHVLSSSGGTSTSASFALTTTLSDLVIGASSNHGAILQSGFWSFSGSGSIPLVLAVKRNVLMPEHCDLVWSGNDRRYDVYAGSCGDVLGSFYASTSSNRMWNVIPPAGTLSCFNVIPAQITTPPSEAPTSDSKER